MPVSSICCGKSPLTVACVPTGMNAGVGNAPVRRSYSTSAPLKKASRGGGPPSYQGCEPLRGGGGGGPPPPPPPPPPLPARRKEKRCPFFLSCVFFASNLIVLPSFVERRKATPTFVQGTSHRSSLHLRAVRHWCV